MIWTFQARKKTQNTTKQTPTKTKNQNKHPLKKKKNKNPPEISIWENKISKLIFESKD